MSKSPKLSLWRERLASPLTWHYAGFAILLLLTIGLMVRLGMDWAATDTHSTDVLAAKQMQLKALRLETLPLHGLGKRVQKTRAKLLAFYQDRIPHSYSAISSRIDQLGVASGVRLSRVQYTQGPPGATLTEIRMEAGISGSYPDIMHFINSLERDKTFFLIRAMSLTGERSGQVNLRLLVSTWLRPADAVASGLPRTPAESQTPAATSTAGQEDQ
jgi:Tfp pilus assembly protein PilO